MSGVMFTGALKRPLSRRLLTFGILTCGFLLIAEPAHAGQWQLVSGVTYSPDGQWDTSSDEYKTNSLYQQGNTHISSGPTPSSPDVFQYDYDWAAWPTDFWSFWGSAGEGATEVKSKGRVRYKLHWDAGPNNDPVPSSVLIKVGYRSFASISTGTTQTDGDASVSCLGKDASKVPMIGSAYAPGSGVADTEVVTKYIQMDTNSNPDIYGPWINLSATASLAANRYQQNAGGGSTPAYGDLFFTYLYDAYEATGRGVAISSDIDQSYRKSTEEPFPDPAGPGQPSPTPIPPIIGTNPPVWRVPVPAGEPVHSAAHWSTSDNIWVGSATYQYSATIPSGAGITSAVWSGLTPISPIQAAQMANGTNPIDISISLGSQPPESASKSLTITLTDTTGLGNLTDTYDVIWHAPYENWHTHAPDQMIHQVPSLDIDSPGYASLNGGIGVDFNYELANWGAVVEFGGSAFAGIAGAIATNPIWGGLWAAVGVAAADIGQTEPDHITINYNDCWGDSRSTWDVPKPSNSPAGGYYMIPEHFLGYTIKSMEADANDKHGFLGLLRRTVSKANKDDYSIGHFFSIDADGGDDN